MNRCELGLKGFCELIRRVANDGLVSPANNELAMQGIDMEGK